MILYLVRHGIAVDRNDPKSPPEAETAADGQRSAENALGGAGAAGAGRESRMC